MSVIPSTEYIASMLVVKLTATVDNERLVRYLIIDPSLKAKNFSRDIEKAFYGTQPVRNVRGQFSKQRDHRIKAETLGFIIGGAMNMDTHRNILSKSKPRDIYSKVKISREYTVKSNNKAFQNVVRSRNAAVTKLTYVNTHEKYLQLYENRLNIIRSVPSSGIYKIPVTKSYFVSKSVGSRAERKNAAKTYSASELKNKLIQSRNYINLMDIIAAYLGIHGSSTELFILDNKYIRTILSLPKVSLFGEVRFSNEQSFVYYDVDSCKQYIDYGSNGNDCLSLAWSKACGVPQTQINDAIDTLKGGADDDLDLTVYDALMLARIMNISIHICDIAKGVIGSYVQDKSAGIVRGVGTCLYMCYTSKHCLVLNKQNKNLIKSVVSDKIGFTSSGKVKKSKTNIVNNITIWDKPWPIPDMDENDKIIDLRVKLMDLPKGVHVFKYSIGYMLKHLVDQGIIPEHKFAGPSVVYICYMDRTVYFNSNPHEALRMANYKREAFVNKSVASYARSNYLELTGETFDSNAMSYFSSSKLVYEFSKNIGGWLHRYINDKQIDQTEFNRINDSKRKIFAYDVNKQYRTIMETYDCPVISVDDVPVEITVTDNNLAPGWYYISTSNADLCSRNIPTLHGWVHYLCLIEFLNDIQYSEITHYLTCRHNSTYKVIPKLLDTSLPKDISKLTVNSLIGSFGMSNNKIMSSNILVKDRDEAEWIAFINNGSSESFTENSYRVSTSYLKTTVGSSAVYNRFIVQMGYASVKKLINRLTQHDSKVKIVYIKTDCVYCQFSRGVSFMKINANDTVKKLSRSEINNTHILISNRYDNDKDYVMVPLEKSSVEIGKWSNDNLPFDWRTSCLIDAGPGYGKSELIKLLVAKFKKENLSIAVLAPSNVAASLIGGITIDKFFGICMSSAPALNNVASKYSCIVIDEYSMVNQVSLYALYMLKRNNPKLQFIVCGDKNQLPCVDDKDIDTSTCNIWNEIVNGNTVKLTHCYRNSYVNDLINEKIDIESFAKCTDIYKYKTHIAFTNDKCKSINKLLVSKYGKLSTGSRLIWKHKSDTAMGLYKNSVFSILKSTDKYIVMQCINNNRKIKLDFKTYKNVIAKFSPGFCFTVHACQGLNITDKYMIHESYKFCNYNMLYVALTRGSNINNIFINNLDNGVVGKFKPFTFLISKYGEAYLSEMQHPYYIGVGCHEPSCRSMLNNGRFDSTYEFTILEHIDLKSQKFM